MRADYKKRGECECGTRAGKEKLFGVRVCDRCFALYHTIRQYRPNVIEIEPDEAPGAPEAEVAPGPAGMVIRGYGSYAL